LAVRHGLVSIRRKAEIASQDEPSVTDAEITRSRERCVRCFLPLPTTSAL
jgi:hypothetical protein